MTGSKLLTRSLRSTLILISIIYLFLPLLAIFLSQNPIRLLASLNSELVVKALVISLESTFAATGFIVGFGTVVAYWLAKHTFKGKRFLEVALQMPIVAPPSVAGVGLLLVFGHMGVLGPLWSKLGMEVAFQFPAVVMAQIFMAAPFYIASARQSFAAVDDHYIAVSRTLGVTAWKTFWRISVPLALPGLLSGIALSWARAMGEFGATMMFAGNLPGKTQTLPLAIYTAMEADTSSAVAISALLLLVSFLLLLLVGIIDKRMQHAVPAS
ncbi:MAG: NifC-like ABC-type porter [Bacilli bacterium]|nr:NifC-like ABC-type porter [Bacilli bacterium]